MNDFIKASALVLVAVIFCLTLQSDQKHFSILVSICVCMMVAFAAMQYLEPVLKFLKELQSMGQWNRELFSVLLKAVGIGIIMQIITLICADSGNASLGKSIHLLGTTIILSLSIPLFTELISVVNELLTNI